MAEEASLVDVKEQQRKLMEKFLNKGVNVFEVVLKSTNVFLAANHEKHPMENQPNTVVKGYASRWVFMEFFGNAKCFFSNYPNF